MLRSVRPRPEAATSLLVAWVAVVLAAAPSAREPQISPIDAAFARFWRAASQADAGRAVDAVLASGVTFDDALARLRAGRPYDADVPTGVIERTRDGRFPYTLRIPSSYLPDRRYPVRVQLHGGIGRTGPGATRDGIDRLAGADQIYIAPAGWRSAPWWSVTQVDNLRAILDEVKRRWNVDENRVALSGVSDGGTGAYYLAMRDPTPYAAILPLNGFVLVLANPQVGVVGDVFPGNLRNRPFFIVNGGRDRLYPTSVVEPYVLAFADRGVTTTYRPQPEAGHDTSWWPEVRDEFEAFAAAHPRDPLPDRLTWETSDPDGAGRVHWLVIDELGVTPGDTPDMDDLNVIPAAAGFDLGLRVRDLAVTRVIDGSNAEQLGFQVGDVIERMGDRDVTTDAGILEAVQAHAIGAPVTWRVRRGGREVVLTGTHAPVEVTLPASTLFEHARSSGRVDLDRRGNTVELTTRGVKALTLLLSPDQFDFAQPVVVTANGRTVFEGRVERSIETLLRWAARDNDRTMLFGAALSLTIDNR